MNPFGIFVLEGGQPTVALSTSMLISSFGEDEASEIYVVNYQGTVHRIRRSQCDPPNGPVSGPVNGLGPPFGAAADPLCSNGL